MFLEVLRLIHHQNPQDLFCRIALTELWYLALRHVEPLLICMCPLLKLVRVSLDDCVDFSIELGFNSKLAENTLDPTVNLTDNVVEDHWSQDGPLGNTIPQWSPCGHTALTTAWHHQRIH